VHLHLFLSLYYRMATAVWYTIIVTCLSLYLMTQTGPTCCKMTLLFCSFLLSISSAFSSSLFWMIPTQLVLHDQKFCKSWKTIVIIHPQGKSETLLLSLNNLLSSVPASYSTKSLLSNTMETSAGPKPSCYSRPHLCI